MHPSWMRTPLGLLGLGLALAASASACHSSEEHACDLQCDCDGRCGQENYDFCIHNFERLRDKADARGCEDTYDSLMDCLDDADCSEEGNNAGHCGWMMFYDCIGEPMKG